MFLEILTPDKKNFSGDVASVKVPGTSGSFEVLNNHSPIISSLEKGKVRIKTSEGIQFFNIDKGVIEVLKNKVVVLSEKVSVITS